MSTALRSTSIGALALALVAGLVVSAAPGATAATSVVTITSSGYVPKDTTITVGDTVTFTNGDSAAHEVTVKPTTGVTCTITPMVVQPGASQSCTFASAGNFSITDPNAKGNTYRGTISVQALPTVNGSVTLAASAKQVVYGSKVKLTGKISPAKGGVMVDVLARPHPEQGFAKVASIATEPDGSYSYAEPTRIRTEYKVQFADGATKGESATVAVSVRPKVTLALKRIRSGKATFRTGAVSSVSYAGKQVLLQRRNSAGGWTTVKKITLGDFSTRTFTVKVPSGSSRWRTYLQAAQAGAGYVASWSPTRTVRR